ncbi:MAG: thioredoxin domain-containing protein, partial [bacterium]|nr:thioredoxin domain-containing protein [bacterium]
MLSKQARWTLVAAAIVGVLVFASPAVRAEDPPPSNQELKQGQESLKTELGEVKSELQAVRKDLKRVLAELTAIKRGQAAKPKKPNKRKADTRVYDVKTGNSPTLGPDNAKVTIVEFADFQCPYCIREFPKIQQMLKEYPNDVRFVFKNFPLSFHKQAKPVHAAGVLAAKKDTQTFWKMHDLILANPKKLAVAELRKHAESLGMDLEKFDMVMADSAQIDALLAADMAEAKRCGVRGTPTVLVNGLKLANRKIDGYKGRIDE